MKKEILAVCDSEEGYAGNFAEYLNTRKKLPFRAEAFTNPEKFCQYAEKNPTKFLLIAEEDLCSEIQSLEIPHMITLSADKDQDPKEEHCIYKYQSAEALIQEVMTYCKEDISERCGYKPGKELRFIGVYSPLGRCGKTLFALTAGQIWGERQNVLYLNMEDFSGWPGFSDTPPTESLKDVFYCLHQGRALPSPDSIICSWGNLDYIYPVSSFEDLHSISFKDWSDFFRYMEQESHYQIIILDIGNGVDQLFSLLELCTQIYMPVMDDWISRQKISQFLDMVPFFSESLEHKLLEIHLPFAPCIKKDQDFPRNLLWGKWGTDIRKLLEVKLPIE